MTSFDFFIAKPITALFDFVLVVLGFDLIFKKLLLHLYLSILDFVPRFWICSFTALSKLRHVLCWAASLCTWCLCKCLYHHCNTCYCLLEFASLVVYLVVRLCALISVACSLVLAIICFSADSCISLVIAFVDCIVHVMLFMCSLQFDIHVHLILTGSSGIWFCTTYIST